jgi:hypothetical protein
MIIECRGVLSQRTTGWPFLAITEARDFKHAKSVPYRNTRVKYYEGAEFCRLLLQEGFGNLATIDCPLRLVKYCVLPLSACTLGVQGRERTVLD